MDPQPVVGVAIAGREVPSESDVFATLHHLVSRIDTEDRMQEVAERAQSLEPEQNQLLVNCLSMALDKNAAPLKTRAYVWRLLIKVASSTKVLAQNHTLRSDLAISPTDPSSNVYHVHEEPSVRVQVLRRAQDDTHGCDESLVQWAHFSHPNIIPLYAIFLEGDDHPCFVTPYTTNQSICDYIRECPQVPRMPLVSDLVSGLFYIHQLDIVHGGLYPKSVLISGDGRALITDLVTPSGLRDPDSVPVRYSAPEILEEDDIRPTKAADMWSFACLCYEVLSGNIPFHQFGQERKLLLAVAKGAKPIQPDEDGHEGNKIDDTIWQLLLLCWDLEPADRPPCLKVHQIILGMGIQDDRPPARPMVGPDTMKSPSTDFDRARADLTEVLGSDYASSLRVPEHIHKLILRLVPDTVKFEATATAAKKFSPDDTQCFVDFLDLVLEDLPAFVWMGIERDAIRTLLSTLMVSTRIIPQRYILNGVQYDSQELMAEGNFGKAYRGRGANIRVNVVTNPSFARSVLKQLPNWFHLSHPNFIPLYGVFDDGASESPQLRVVTPLWTKGNLRNYAPTLPQRLRLPLIFDVISGLAHSHDLGFTYSPFRPMTPEYFLISNEGRAVLLVFSAQRIFTEYGATMSTYENRFTPPSPGVFDNNYLGDIWSFGCLCYEILSRRPPYHQYSEDAQIQAAASRGEVPERPNRTDNSMDEIDDEAWSLIMQCCALDYRDRPPASQVRELIARWGMDDVRPEAKNLPVTDILALRSRPDVNFPHVETLLGKIQVELLRSPLSKLVQSRTREVAAATAELEADDIRTFVDFLDLALKDHLTITEERNRVLALLSKVTSSTNIFPQRYEVKGIKYTATPIAEGGFGTVHKGLNFNMCVKVMSRVDTKALAEWIKELILWAHSSHPNVLPFYGVFLESVGGFERLCLVSPFMKNGNLHDYAPRLPPKSRLPLILDVINGLQYIHGLGIIHSDLKGQNVLISDEGRGFITDFGASHIVTATAAAAVSSVYSTLRYAAPEMMQDDAQPSKESDVWSFGCLCYQVLSRKIPYYQYARDFQVAAALSRKELPKRPSPIQPNHPDDADEDNWDEGDDEDWDTIDDQSWNLITKCCAPEPKDRAKVPAIQELIADMKVWDERPAMRAIPGAEIFQLRLKPEIDMNRVAEVLDKLQMVVAPSESGPQRDFVDVFNDLR